jgi:hypothetical protein
MKKVTMLSLLVVVFLLALGGVAQAATPQDILNDFRDNGVLDGIYTDEELEAYLNDATIHGYPDTVVDDLDVAVREILVTPTPDPATPTQPTQQTATQTRSTFPFTGFQMLIAAIAVVVLVGGGVALRLKSRSAE